MPVSALSKKLASPSVPLMTLTTESFPAALALPDEVPVVADDEQPVSARARAEAAASPSFSWRFMYDFLLVDCGRRTGRVVKTGPATRRAPGTWTARGGVRPRGD